MRVVIADDETLLREGLAPPPRRGGLRRRRQGGDRRQAPPPGRAHAARRGHRRHQNAAHPHGRRPRRSSGDPKRASRGGRARALALRRVPVRNAPARRAPERSGYLLKERVSDVAVLVDALHRIDEGECGLDPTIVARLVGRPRDRSPLDELTERELEVLSLIAEGHSNEGICKRLFLSPKTVETHVRHILGKLGIGETSEYNRRVLAVLAHLRSS